MPEGSAGLAVTGGGALLLSVEGLLVGLMHSNGATIVTWYGIAMAVGLAIIVVSLRWTSLLGRAVSLRWQCVVAAPLFGLDNALFLTALRRTTVADTMFIVAAAPTFSALIARTFLRERLPLRTWVMALGVFLGLGLVFARIPTRGRLLGDLAALGAAILIAIILNLFRSVRGDGMLPSLGVGALMASAVISAVGAPHVPHGRDILLICALGLFVAPAGFSLISIGPRHLPAAEVSLLMLLESVFAPLWVWAARGQRPEVNVLVGGCLILLAVGANAILTLREASRIQRPVTVVGSPNAP